MEAKEEAGRIITLIWSSSVFPVTQLPSTGPCLLTAQAPHKGVSRVGDQVCSYQSHKTKNRWLPVWLDVLADNFSPGLSNCEALCILNFSLSSLYLCQLKKVKQKQWGFLPKMCYIINIKKHCREICAENKDSVFKNYAFVLPLILDKKEKETGLGMLT